MNKSTFQALLLLIIFILIIGTRIFLFYDNQIFNDYSLYDVSNVGSSDNGTVYKVVAGNESSNQSIGIILGIHPREHEIHKAMLSTFYQLCGAPNAPKNLTKKYVIYYVEVNNNITGYQESRAAGEVLGQEFIVPNIIKDNVSMVVDLHMIDESYEFYNFIFPVTDDPISNEYANFIANYLSIANYNFTEGTSPLKITVPIAEFGIPAMLIEFDINSNNSTQNAQKVIQALEELKLY